MDSASMASLDCLPDDLLVQILSSLTIKQAASTSILAKRWRTLFAFRHTLDFDDTIFWHPEDRKHRRVDIRESFRDFVDRSLALQGGNNHLKKFSLKYLEILCSQNFVVDRWICDALEHSLSELHLLLYAQGRGSLPSKIFTTTTLVKLSLGTNLYLGKSVPSDASLPALKILFLDSVWIETEVFNNVFLPACPALEDLTVKGTPQQGFPDAISTKSVKRLTVAHNDGLFIPGGFISLDTPKLVDLYYADYVRPQSPHCNLDSLEKATLDLHFPEEDDQFGTPDPDVTDLMSGIRNIMTLHLTTSSAEVISVSCKGGLPVFNNLVELFFSSKKRGWKKLLPLLLERSPNLKTLVVSGLERCTYGRRRFVGVPISANNQVKVLCIMQCQGSASELKHIGHFLLKMEFLEVVMVYVAPGTMDDPSKVQQLTEDLLKLPTASSKLKIQVM